MGFIEDKRFSKYNARCLFFDRNGGASKDPFESLNVSFSVGDDKEKVRENLNIISNIVSAEDLALLNQVHSNTIVEYSGNVYDADGFYTTKRKIFLGIRFADCLPIVFMDTKNRIIMSIHAGWRGTLLGISKNAVELFKSFGSKTDDIIVSIGPHICGNCYEIKEDTAIEFNDKFITHKDGKMFLDMEAVNIEQMVKGGIPKSNIQSFGVCTFENKNFFSYRRDGVCGRNIGGIILH